MIAPIDDNIRRFQKGLYISERYGYEDPTYLGFSLAFDLDPSHKDPNTGQTHDPLFAEPGLGIGSAQEYLNNIGFKQKSKMIKEFKEIIRYMNKNAPYYFQGITGVSDLWRIKKGKDFTAERGYEKKLKISCLESVDLRMTALANLYKSASWDNDHMRDLLPENLKWFTLRVRIAEVRSFHKIKDALTTGNNSSNNGDMLALIENQTSVIEFELGHCMFDFEDSFGDEFLMDGTMNAATQSFTIEVGTIKQIGSYNLLNLLIRDHYSVTSGGIIERSDIIGGKFSGTSNNDNTDRNVLADVPLGSRIPGYGTNPNNLFGGAVSALTDQANTFTNDFLRTPGNTIAGQVNNLQSQVTGGVMGNVYGTRSVSELLNGFTSGPDQIAMNELGDVYPNSADEVKTKTADELGNTHGNPSESIKSQAAHDEALRQGIQGDNIYSDPDKATKTKTEDNIGNIYG